MSSMEGSGRRSSEESRAEKLMDEYLKSVGFHRKKVAKDGSCLFRAVAEQVLNCQNLHSEVRAECGKFLRKNRDVYEAFIEGDFEKYLEKLQDPQQWVGEVEINALAIIYKRDFQIFQEVGKPAVSITDNNFKDKVRLCFLNGNHYDSVYPISRMKNAALCQSILYELLYDGVFKVDRSLLTVCQRSGRPSDLLSDDNMTACQSSDDSDVESSDPLWLENETSNTSTRVNNNNHSYRGRGRGRQLPDRVRRSLNPTLLRNVEYDVWQKTKKAQQKMDYCIATGMQFNVGDRCQVRLDSSGRSYSATVKEVPVNSGPVKVLVEEFGIKSVPLWSLRPPCDDSSWSSMVNRDKKLKDPGEWEVKGRGRGRGKGLTASMSLPTAGLDRRVQRQTSDEPGKASRKSQCEQTFGLTEEQRLFREEEQRNVALVEIQLRDELSFPALGTQPDTEKGKKGGEKKRVQRSKTSPDDEVEAPPPDVGPSSLPTAVTPPTPEAPPISIGSSVQSSTLLTSSAPLSTPFIAATLPDSAPVSSPPTMASNTPLSSALVSEPTTPESPTLLPPSNTHSGSASLKTLSSSTLFSAAPNDSSPPPAEAPPHCPISPPPPCPVEAPSESVNRDLPPPPPLPQVYHDPLYPGFPQAVGGGIAPNPPFSRSQSGDDLPQDVGILRFFFNLGLKHTHMIQSQRPPVVDPQPTPPSPWQQTPNQPCYPTPYPPQGLQPPPQPLHPPPVRFQETSTLGAESQTTNGDAVLDPVQLPRPPVANVANVNDAQAAAAAAVMAPGFASMEPEHAHVEQLANHKAPLASGVDLSVSMTTRTSSGPGSSPYREAQQTWVSAGNPEWAGPRVEENWEQTDGHRGNHRGYKKHYRGKWGGPRRGPPRRRHGDVEAGFGQSHYYYSSYRGRGYEQGY
ncbi:OTU domain-containing protein 4 isoform X2 [Gouania willdenowi]|uniref:OTU domain-containing protein 4 isoform X2 n=1 Tax=Gouania willdenowi TaxID=441366 RepID=UPI001056BBDD|nr:OTU domain-containing protein 4 isoform X2 [Gouania willdenowi]